MGRIARIFLAGLLVLLPILVTLTVTVWLAQLLKAYAGPNSLIGRLIVLLGLNLVSSEVGAYFLGFLIILGCIFLLIVYMLPRGVAGLFEKLAATPGGKTTGQVAA